MNLNNALERLFQGGAALLVTAALYFWWQGNFDRVFIAAVFGSLCFFISIRFQVKERLRLRELNASRSPELASGDGFEGARSEFEQEPTEVDNPK